MKKEKRRTSTAVDSSSQQDRLKQNYKSRFDLDDDEVSKLHMFFSPNRIPSRLRKNEIKIIVSLQTIGISTSDVTGKIDYANGLISRMVIYGTTRTLFNDLIRCVGESGLLREKMYAILEVYNASEGSLLAVILSNKRLRTEFTDFLASCHKISEN